MSLFPELTAEMIEAARIRSMADIFWITICDDCGDVNYGCRLGCCCIGGVKWVLRTADGRNLIPNVDVCLLEQEQ